MSENGLRAFDEESAKGTHRIVTGALSILLFVSLFAAGFALCEVNPSEILFGPATAGVFVREELVIFNPGSDVLDIYGISVNCGCSHCGCKTAVVGPIPKSLAPGKSASIRVVVDTTYVMGELEETLVIRTSAGDYSVPVYGLVSLPEPWRRSVARLNSELMLIVDVRSKDAYDAGHLVGAISIPSRLLPDYLTQIPGDIFLLFYDEGAGLLYSVLDQLYSVGFCHVWGLIGGFRGWMELYGTQLVEMRTTSLESLLSPHDQSTPCDIAQGRQMISPETFYKWATVLIDIRNESEYVAEHLVGAISIPAASGIDVPSWVPAEVPLLVYSNAGEADEDIVQMLNDSGHRAFSLLGGLNEWKAQVGQRFLVKP